MNFKIQYDFELFSDLFPEFTGTQKENVFLYALGIPKNQIADIRGVSIGSVVKSLMEAQQRLDLGTVGSLRAVVKLRLMLTKSNFQYNGINEKLYLGKINYQ
ncbi:MULTISPECIES: hypothetical protein [Arsenophonus]|uniref:hypothetical protein n=1 Tax=Arsenophonus TaxID=637 RepID=UPI001CDD6A6F|nr:hypothetical protein [Arsenophonus apicola]UBX30642.1 hypothetical protein LDL57_15905 [Arsenophonus apicola]